MRGRKEIVSESRNGRQGDAQSRWMSKFGGWRSPGAAKKMKKEEETHAGRFCGSVFFRFAAGEFCNSPVKWKGLIPWEANRL